MTRQRASFPVDRAAFLLFHPRDFRDLSTDALVDVPESALVDGLVIGLRLGADGWRAADVVIGEELTSGERAELDGPPWIFRLDVRNGALTAGDGLDSRGGDRIKIASGKYRVEWFKLRHDAIQRRNANWLVRLTPVGSFDGIGAWIDPPNGVMPDEDMFPEQRTPRLATLSDLTESEARVRTALKRVQKTAPEPFRVDVEGEKRFVLDGAELRVDGETWFVPPVERHRAAVMLRRFAPWWLAAKPSGVKIAIEVEGGRLERTSTDADAKAAYELMAAFAEAIVRRAKTLATFEALVRSGLPEDVTVIVTTRSADYRVRPTTIETTIGAIDRDALSAILVENRIWEAPTEFVAAPAVSIEFRVPTLGEYHYPLEFWGKDEASSPVAAVRDLLAET